MHTNGGCVTSCVMIADALRRFPRSRAIVPYMALSGGTMIALNAHELQMGASAALSAVDPQISGRRARHIPKEAEDGLHPLAQEYDQAVSGFLRETLWARLRGRGGDMALEHAMRIFMGEQAPHAWPIKAEQVRTLGIPVTPADKCWARIVDLCQAERDTAIYHLLPGHRR